MVVLSAFRAFGEAPPELELLEYLFEWQDEDGAVLEPRMFDDDGGTQLEEDTGVFHVPG